MYYRAAIVSWAPVIENNILNLSFQLRVVYYAVIGAALKYGATENQRERHYFLIYVGVSIW